MQYCPLRNYTKNFAEMWGVYSLLWDSVCLNVCVWVWVCVCVCMCAYIYIYIYAHIHTHSHSHSHTHTHLNIQINLYVKQWQSSFQIEQKYRKHHTQYLYKQASFVAIDVHRYMGNSFRKWRSVRWHIWTECMWKVSADFGLTMVSRPVTVVVESTSFWTPQNSEYMYQKINLDGVIRTLTQSLISF